MAEAHDHELSFQARGPIPPVLGFERLLREALVNYITNAIKYTPNGGRISVHILSRASTVRVEVADSGIGIAPQDQERLFRDFVRIPSRDAQAPRVKGSGLGLSIVKRIVVAHGGRAGVESDTGQGSTFFLELPALPG